MNQDQKKEKSAKEAYKLIEPSIRRDSVIGIGTGSTTNYFIEELNQARLDIKGVVCSSEASAELIDNVYQVLSLNEVHSIDFYVDGADEFNDRKELIKGGGGALTREKILASCSETFICIVDESKFTNLLGSFPLPIEVLEIARSAISRELMKMGGKPIFRNGFTTDNGHQIIDIHNLPMEVPYELEEKINNLPGVVENGIFSKRKADVILSATDYEIKEIRSELKDKAEDYRKKFVELAVELDDEVMEQYLEGNEPDVNSLKACIRKGTLKGNLFYERSESSKNYYTNYANTKKRVNNKYFNFCDI